MRLVAWLLVIGCGTPRESPPAASAGSAIASTADAAVRVAPRDPPKGPPRRVVTLTSRTEAPELGAVFAADDDVLAATDVIERDPRRIAVRVGRWTGSRFDEEAAIAPPAGADDWFGGALAVDGNLLAISSRRALHLFRGAAGAWAATETIELVGERACGSSPPEHLALVGETIVVGSQGDEVCVFEHRGAAWTRTLALDADGPFGGYSPFRLDGNRLVLTNDRTETVEIYSRTGTGWAKTTTIEAPANRTTRFAASAVAAGDLLAVGLANEIQLFDLAAAPPRAIGRLEPQSFVEVPAFGRWIALRRPRMAVYERDGTDLYVERDGRWQPGGRLPQVRSGSRVSFTDRIEIADLVWVGETDSNQSSGPLPGGGKIYGYRWE